MVNKSTIFAIILIVLAIGFICFGVAFTLGDINNDNIKTSDNMFVIESTGLYGVMDASGNEIAKPLFNNIARINNVIYLKNDQVSYLYNLDTKETVTLDGMETDIYYIYNSVEDKFEDKFILKYGSDEGNAIYRLIDVSGNRITNKDYASISAVYTYLELVQEEDFSPKAVSENSLNKNSIVSTLSYPTIDGKSQYIVKTADGTTTKYGISDEDNKQILPIEYDSIETIKDGTKACLAKKGNITYAILNTGDVIEIEDGFEADISNNGFVIQKIGTTANKIYNYKGKVLVDKIFTYPAEITSFDTGKVKYMAMKDSKTNIWTIYNIDTTEPLEKTYTNIVTEYSDNIDDKLKNSTLIYKTTNGIVGMDLNTFEEYRINIPYNIVASLDSGYKLSSQILDKEE